MDCKLVSCPWAQADLAQLAAHCTCNAGVMGSSPIVGSMKKPPNREAFSFAYFWGTPKSDRASSNIK